MRKILVLLLAFMCLFGATGHTEGYDPRPAIFDMLDGYWYNDDGRAVYKFEKGNYIIIQYRPYGTFAYKVLAVEVIGKGDLYDWIFTIVNLYGYFENIEVMLQQREGSTSFMSIGEVGEKWFFYQNTPTVNHFESVGNVYLGMTKRHVEELCGPPDSFVNSVAVYNRDGWKIDYLYGRVAQIHMLQGGTRHLNKSGMNADSSIEELARAYDVKGEGTPGFYFAENDARIPLPSGEHLFIRKDPDTGRRDVLLSIWRT